MLKFSYSILIAIITYIFALTTVSAETVSSSSPTSSAEESTASSTQSTSIDTALSPSEKIPSVASKQTISPQNSVEETENASAELERQRILLEREKIRLEREKLQLSTKIRTPRKAFGLILSGAINLGLGYTCSIVLGSFGMLFDELSALQFIPVFGGPAYGATLFEYDPLAFLFFSIPAIMQITGLALMIPGLIKRSRAKQKRASNVSIAPILFKDQTGIAFSMVF